MVNVSPSICHVTLVAGEPVVVQVRLEDEPESDVVEVIPIVLGGYVMYSSTGNDNNSPQNNCRPTRKLMQ